MQCKTVLITGANSGIGKAASLALARMGARVLMHARDQARGEAAKKEIIELSGNNDIDLFLCDLADLDQVRDMAERVKNSYPQIDVLINRSAELYKSFNSDVLISGKIKIDSLNGDLFFTFSVFFK